MSYLSSLGIFTSWTSIIIVALLVIIFGVTAVGLAKAYKYLAKIIPSEEATRSGYLTFSAKLELAKAKYEEYTRRIEELEQEYQKSLEQKALETAQADDLDKRLAAAKNDLEQENLELEKTRSAHFELKTELEGMNKEKQELESVKKDLADSKAALEKAMQELKVFKGSEEYLGIDKAKAAYSKAVEDTEKEKLLLGIAQGEAQKLKEEIEELKKQKSGFKEFCDKVESLAGEKKQLEHELEDKRNSIADKGVELKKLESEFAKLQADVDESKQLSLQLNAGYSSLYNCPELLREYSRRKEDSIGTEIDELNSFMGWLRSDGKFFTKRIIKAFHTSLKIQSYNPLTVLAGISGTGKTLLPLKYAEYFGIYKLVVPVQPRWDSPQDLLGFYNYLEKKYQATELSRTLFAFDPYNTEARLSAFTKGKGLSDEQRAMISDALEVSRRLENKMVLVLLDEMNLARTEYYFSEFLSRLEMRRLVNDPKNETSRSNAEVLIDNRFGGIWVPENVMFVGTMNEDESTQTLSDKVLDRANLLRFGKPDESSLKAGGSARTGSIAEAHSALEYSTWKQWIKAGQGSVSHDDRQTLLERIGELNEAMSLVGKSFGYRIRDSIVGYVEAYPKEDEEADFNNALADQIELKILPKLRGLDVTSDPVRECLEKISNVIGGLKDDELSQAFEQARSEESAPDGMFVWNGVTRE